MVHTITLRQIGNSEGVILPKELLADLNIKEGDKLFVHRTPAGIELSPYDNALAEDMERAVDIGRRYRNTLHKLAQEVPLDKA